MTENTLEPCNEWLSQVLALQEDMLSEGERQAVQAHLAGCRACAAAYHRLQEADKLLQHLPQYTMPPGLPHQLLSQWATSGIAEETEYAAALPQQSAPEFASSPGSTQGQTAPDARLLAGSSEVAVPAGGEPGRASMKKLARQGMSTPGYLPGRSQWLWSFAALLLAALIIVAALFGVIASRRHNEPPTGSPANVPRWIQMYPSGGPPAPRGPGADGAVGYDVTHNRLIFFGGVTTENVSLNDTWVLVNADGSTGAPQWVQLATVSTPAPHKGQAGAYDAVNNRLIIYGGCLGQCTPLDDSVYVLTNANGLGGTPTWQQLHPTGGPPPSRTSFTAVYDQTNNRLIIFGGEDTLGTRYNDTWVLTHANGLDGVPAWIPLTPADDPPPARKLHAAVFIPATNQLLVYGGDSRASPWLNEMWVLSNANGLGGASVWSEITPGSVVPPARVTPALIYDPTSNQVLLYGGSHPGGVLGDSWVLTNPNGLGSVPDWKQLEPSGATPAPRNSPLTGYNPASKRLILFGGGSPSGELFNDLWVLALQG